MPPGHRLRDLEMGEAGHHPVLPPLGLPQEGAHQALDPPHRVVAGVPDPQPQVRRHLVVARARRVQPPRRLADQGAQPGLHVHVDVLQIGAEVERAALDLRQYREEAFTDRARVLITQDAGLGEHGGVGARARDVLRGEAAVEPNRGVDRLHHGIGA